MAPVGNVHDLFADSKVWQWAGVNFGDYDTLLLQKSMRDLSAKTGASSIRLWGKINGTEADYYVAEAQLGEDGGNEGEEGDTKEEMEPRGQKESLNQFVYFVTNSPLKPWI